MIIKVKIKEIIINKIKISNKKKQNKNKKINSS